MECKLFIFAKFKQFVCFHTNSSIHWYRSILGLRNFFWSQKNFFSMFLKNWGPESLLFRGFLLDTQQNCSLKTFRKNFCISLKKCWQKYFRLKSWTFLIMKRSADPVFQKNGWKVYDRKKFWRPRIGYFSCYLNLKNEKLTFCWFWKTFWSLFVAKKPLETTSALTKKIVKNSKKW